jgi:hypothetical protein
VRGGAPLFPNMNLKINRTIWSASYLNSQHTQAIHPLRIEDNPRSAAN